MKKLQFFSFFILTTLYLLPQSAMAYDKEDEHCICALSKTRYVKSCDVCSPLSDEERENVKKMIGIKKTH